MPADLFGLASPPGAHQQLGSHLLSIFIFQLSTKSVIFSSTIHQPNSLSSQLYSKCKGNHRSGTVCFMFNRCCDLPCRPPGTVHCSRSFGISAVPEIVILSLLSKDITPSLSFLPLTFFFSHFSFMHW